MDGYINDMIDLYADGYFNDMTSFHSVLIVDPAPNDPQKDAKSSVEKVWDIP